MQFGNFFTKWNWKKILNLPNLNAWGNAAALLAQQLERYPNKDIF